MTFYNGKDMETGETIEEVFKAEVVEREPSNNKQECIAFANLLMEETKKELEKDPEMQSAELIAVLSSEARNWVSLSLAFGD